MKNVLASHDPQQPYGEARMSQITDSIINDLKQRSETGFAKYGTTMDRNDLTRKQWLQHLYEELLDAAQYTKKLIMEENQ